MPNTRPACPHCGTPLEKWLVPEGSTWLEKYFYVCFANACPYYRRGWDWMMQRYGQVASYRYMLNPATGAASQIPVWSDAATREMIVASAEEGEP